MATIDRAGTDGTELLGINSINNNSRKGMVEVAVPYLGSAPDEVSHCVLWTVFPDLHNLSGEINAEHTKGPLIHTHTHTHTHNFGVYSCNKWHYIS
jgi:hypothetical protein